MNYHEESSDFNLLEYKDCNFCVWPYEVAEGFSISVCSRSLFFCIHNFAGIIKGHMCIFLPVVPFFHWLWMWVEYGWFSFVFWCSEYNSFCWFLFFLIGASSRIYHVSLIANKWITVKKCLKFHTFMAFLLHFNDRLDTWFTPFLVGCFFLIGTNS